MKRSVRFVAAAACLIGAACETETRLPTQPRVPSSPEAQASPFQRPHHRHVFRRFASEASQRDNNPIQYHGGPIIYAQKVAVIYWSSRTIFRGGPAPGTTGAGSSDLSLVGFFLDHLGGSPYYNINSSYYDGSFTPVQNSVTYTQYWASNTNVPAVNTNVPLATVEAQIQAGFTSGALAFDPNTIYLVFTDSLVEQDNLYHQYGACAAHFDFPWNGNDVKFGAMLRVFDFVYCRQWDALAGAASPNNDSVADAEVNVTAHEIEETNTDPDGNAWYDVLNGTTFENADKCAWQFGSNQIYLTANGKANMNLAGKDFLVQENWINRTGAGNACDVEVLIVSISGPSSMNCTDTYTWTAAATGFGSSYTYVWKQGSQGLGGRLFWYQVGTGPTYTRQGCPSDPYLWLQADATDNFGGGGVAYKTVTLQ